MTGALALAAGLSAFAGCNGDAPRLPPDLPAIGGRVSLIRVPREGGVVEAYAADSLAEPAWTSRAEIGAVRQVLGVNLEARLVFAIEAEGSLVAIDLESRGLRHIAAGVRAGVFVPDGTVYVVDTVGLVTRYDVATPTPYRESLPSAVRFRAGALGDRFVAVTDSTPNEVVVFAADRRLHSATVPSGATAATQWGDLVAVGGDDGVLLVKTGEPFSERRVEEDRPVRELVFSPSGHRLYVATADDQVAVIDRYSLEQLATIALPGPGRAIRTDGSGRWMLVQAANGESAWVVDLATGRVTATAATSWGDDLPTVAGAATLLARVGADVVGFDLTRSDLPETGRITGGADDLFLVSAWLPREHARLAAMAAESVLVAQDSMLVTDSLVTDLQTDELYLQVSSSQNSDWSNELARQLDAAGYPARVLDPASVDDGYRVVVGPYPSREAAEEIGRKLGRPYFVLTNPGQVPRR